MKRTTLAIFGLCAGMLNAVGMTRPADAQTVSCTGIAAWSGNSVSYAVGALVTYQGSEYKCLQAHTSLSTWDPVDAASLWSKLGTCSTTTGTTTGATCTTKSGAPAGLSAAGTTQTGTTLNWSAVTVPSGCSISGYTVYQGGTAKATVSSGTSYAVTGLSASTTYSFTVTAIDAAGTSAQSSSVSVTTPAASGLNPSLPPGKNFNLSGFTLQLPTGASGSVDTASGTSLAGGFTKSPYFFTDPTDGSMVMADPAVGWTTSGSLHPRVEMRENATWSTAGTNIETATVAVTKVPSNTCIGQIFQGTGPSKPLCELQVNSGGQVQLLLENTNQGGNANEHPVGNVSIGSKFTYSMQLKGTTITVKVNSTTTTFTVDPSFDGENFYFKAGDYDQTAVSGTPSATASTVVKFYALTITH